MIIPIGIKWTMYIDHIALAIDPFLGWSHQVGWSFRHRLLRGRALVKKGLSREGYRQNKQKKRIPILWGPLKIEITYINNTNRVES